MKRLFFAAFVLFSSVLSAQQTNVVEFIVGDAKTACMYNNTIMSCLKIKMHKDSSWKEFPYTIKDFSYEPGFEYQMVVEETKLQFPDEDSMMYSYRLIRVIQKRKTVLDNKILLKGVKWKILNLEQDMQAIPARRAGGYMYFDIDSNRISGFGGCNSFAGNVQIEDGVIHFGNIQNTLISCTNDAIEQKLMEGLKGKAAFYIRNNMLFVVCENHLIIHLRPEKKLDSMVNEINKPVVTPQGNLFKDLRNGHFTVVLEFVQEAVNKNMVFNSLPLTAEDKKLILYKLKNLNPDDNISVIKVLKKPHKTVGMFYAEITFKDGKKKTIVIRNAS